MGISALQEGGLFIYTHLLVYIIPSCHVQACLLDALGLLFVLLCAFLF